MPAMTRFDPRRLLFDRDVLGLMGLGLMVKPLGLVNQMLMARWFGAGESLDAYGLAFFLAFQWGRDERRARRTSCAYSPGS